MTAVRGRYFGANGDYLGDALRVNQELGVDNVAQLANSAQHTSAYGFDGRVWVTWTQGVTPDGVFVTILPATTSGAIAVDCDTDGIPDECELAGNDCNSNGVPDECEVPPLGSGPDCNSNGIPDECDVGGGGGGSDCNTNGIPDDCEPDCNNDGIPNDCEITAGAPDCNGNGWPDDCDIPPFWPGGSDCNGNGVPDECEVPPIGSGPDCNSNGIPDECEAMPEACCIPITGTCLYITPGRCVRQGGIPQGPCTDCTAQPCFSP